MNYLQNYKIRGYIYVKVDFSFITNFVHSLSWFNFTLRHLILLFSVTYRLSICSNSVVPLINEQQGQ